MSLRWNDASAPLSMKDNYTEWMAFKDKTEMVERNLRMTITEFLTADITEKVMSNRLKYMLGSLNAKITFKTGIEPVRAVMFKIDN